MQTQKLNEPQWQMPHARELWAAQRAALEVSFAKVQRGRKNLTRHWDLFEKLVEVGGWFIKCLGFAPRGIYNAKDIQIKKYTLNYPNLPEAFDGYQLLHFTDLHYDVLPGIEHIIAEKVKDLPVDLAVFTGDYREDTQGSFKGILEPMQIVLGAVQAKDGCYGTLGNHDTIYMIEPFERLGLNMLCNQTLVLRRGTEKIYVTGIDDVHYYYTDMALQALENSPSGFKVALVHSAEIHHLAEQFGYSLYLNGHTHGGQICLPGGFPLITHHNVGRKYARGLWKNKNLVGYTSCGTGVVALPYRFNCPGEIAHFTLRRSP